MADQQPYLVEVTPEGIATVTLNRPELHNAFNGELIEGLADAFDDLGKQDGVRVVCVRGNGKSFSAGGDLAWMKRSAELTHEQNVEETLALASMLRTLNDCPKPTIALVHGNAYAGGMGLVAACDIAIASEDAVFCLSEVRLGLIAATISPYVIAAIGPRQARRFFLTAERFGAAEALKTGLVHEVVSDAVGLDAARERFVRHLMSAGPEAVAGSKRLIAHVAGKPVDSELMLYTAKCIAEARASEEGQEGLAAFFDKRKPRWATME
ncbi:MAG: enoyl-CoA hydratase/isomerase family protein [Alphaproteobacteria bacterium]|nr:enoyl-CoA hydratase/isomerase family protein [Alphaproteobacteria bacterium]